MSVARKLQNVLTAWVRRRTADVEEIGREGSFRRMRTGTKLILFLTVVVGVVMTLGGYNILRQREAIPETAMRTTATWSRTSMMGVSAYRKLEEYYADGYWLEL
jgi:hypothetical protein